MSSYGSFHDEAGTTGTGTGSNNESVIKSVDYQVTTSLPATNVTTVFKRDYTYSNRIQILNGSLLVMMVLCWISCCVIFGGVLQTAGTTIANQYPESTTWDFYWNRIHQTISVNGRVDDVVILYDDWDTETRCYSGGKSLVVIASLAFIALSVSSLLATFRTIGKNGAIPFCKSRTTYLSTEVGLSSLTVIFFFVMSVIWGSTCFADSKKYFTEVENGNDNLRATGFAYLCFCLFLSIFVLIIISYLRNLELTNASLMSASNDTLIPPHLSSSATTRHAALSSSFSSTSTPAAFPSAIADFPSAVSQDEI